MPGVFPAGLLLFIFTQPTKNAKCEFSVSTALIVGLLTLSAGIPDRV